MSWSGRVCVTDHRDCSEGSKNMDQHSRTIPCPCTPHLSSSSLSVMSESPRMLAAPRDKHACSHKQIAIISLTAGHSTQKRRIRVRPCAQAHRKKLLPRETWPVCAPVAHGTLSHFLVCVGRPRLAPPMG